MGKVTSKLQITLPKALASQFGIKAGDESEWLAAGDHIHLVPPSAQRHRLSVEERMASFDRATERSANSVRARGDVGGAEAAERGWTREDLYERGRPR